jgi:hypothetical protein
VIRQFGLGLSAMGVGAGIGPPMRGARLRMCWPNRLVRGDRQTVNIAGEEGRDGEWRRERERERERERKRDGKRYKV